MVHHRSTKDTKGHQGDGSLGVSSAKRTVPLDPLGPLDIPLVSQENRPLGRPLGRPLVGKNKAMG